MNQSLILRIVSTATPLTNTFTASLRDPGWLLTLSGLHCVSSKPLQVFEEGEALYFGKGLLGCLQGQKLLFESTDRLCIVEIFYL